MMSKEKNDQAIVPKATRVMEQIPLACALGKEQTMQVHVNVLLKTPIQTLHDLVTHNVAHVEIDKALKEHHQYEDKGDDESTTGNFKKVEREADQSPRARAKVGKKSMKRSQNKEAPQPIKVMPRRALSQNK